MGRNSTWMAGAEFGWEEALAGLKLAGIASGLEMGFVGLRVSVVSKWLVQVVVGFRTAETLDENWGLWVSGWPKQEGQGLVSAVVDL